MVLAVVPASQVVVVPDSRAAAMLEAVLVEEPSQELLDRFDSVQAGPNSLSESGFHQLMVSPQNSALDPVVCGEVSHDMSKPLAHYWIKRKRARQAVCEDVIIALVEVIVIVDVRVWRLRAKPLCVSNHAFLLNSLKFQLLLYQ